MLDFATPLEGIRSPFGRRQGGAAFSPSSLFSTTAIGIWLDPSDVANLAWRRNLLTYSEQFDNAIWTKSNAAVSASVTDPVGGNSADTITATANSAHILQQISVAAGQSMVPSVWIRRRTGTGAINMWNAAGSTVNITSSVSSSWSRVTVPSVIAGSSPFFFLQIATSGDAVDLWGAQLELGTSATDYQRISDVNTEVLERFPTATMFSDRAGTTAVTTPGTVVGLRLDKSKGLALGAELIPAGRGDGTSLTGWTVLNATASLSGGEFEIVTTGSTGLFYYIVTVVPGATYRVAWDARAASGSVSYSVYNQTGGAEIILPTPYTAGVQKQFVFTAPAGCTAARFYPQRNNVTPGTAYFDNISVRELPGNHAVAPTDAARPIYGVEPKGGRRNLLTYSEQFDNAAWTKQTNVTVTPNAGADRDGVMVADQLNFASTTNDSIYQPIAFTAGQTCTFALDVKGTAGQTIQISVQHAGGGNTFTPITFDGSWQRFSATATANTGGTANIVVDAAGATPATACFVSRAQLELGSTATAYQRVTTAYDVTESGVATCHYVQYDGANSSLSTAAIDFTATDKMSVFAGVRKLSDAAFAAFLELSDVASKAGAFGVSAPQTGAGANYSFGSAGSTAVLSRATSPSSFAAPISNVLTGLGDISGDLSTLRLNGTQVAQNTGDQGTGTFGNYPLFIGRRNNATLPFNGRDYGIIIVGKAASAGEITDTETWLAARTAQVTL